MADSVQSSARTQQDYNNDIAKLGAIGQQITSSLDLETILTTVHNNVKELMDTGIFGIAFYREYEGMDSELEFLYYVEHDKFEYMPSAIFSENNSLAAWSITHLREVVVSDREKEFSNYVETLRSEESKSVSQMYFPLIAKNQPIGLLTVQSFQLHAYTTVHVDILKTIASYTAIAIDNLNSYSRLANAAAEMEVMNQSLIELNEKMKKINQDISTLSAMGQKITSTLDYETILSAVYQSVTELMENTSVFGVAVVRVVDNELAYLFFAEQEEQGYHPTLALDDPNSLAVHCIKNRKELILNNVQEQYHQYVQSLRMEEFKAQSLVYFPLIVKGKVVGIMTVQSLTSKAYSDYQVDMLRTIATYTATAIDNIYAYSYLATAFAETENARAEIASLNSHLVELNNEKNEFLGIVAHDLKNPLSGIKMLSKVIHDEIGTISADEVRELSGEILNASARMFDLITNLLDINAIERGGIKVHLTPFEFDGIAMAITENYRTRAEAKEINLQFETVQPMWYAFADPNATIQVLDNIISNAIKYSPHGKNVYVTVRTVDNKVRCEVKDEGPGLNEEDMKKLFGKFARLSAQPTGGEHSTGLGLSIVKRMVEAMKGNVWCESELGHGAMFIVELPGTDEP